MSKQSIQLRRLEIALRVVNGETYKQVGDDLNITPSRVAQIARCGLRAANGAALIGMNLEYWPISEVRKNKPAWQIKIEAAIRNEKL